VVAEREGFEPSVPLARESLFLAEEKGSEVDRSGLERHHPCSQGTSGSNPSRSADDSAFPEGALTPKKSRRRTTSRHRRGLRVANPRQGDFAKPDCETRRRRASGATRPRKNTISQQRLRTMAKNARSPLASRRAVLCLGGSKESADPISRGLSDCAACHHVALLTPEMLLRAGLSPAATSRLAAADRAIGLNQDDGVANIVRAAALNPPSVGDGCANRKFV